MRQRRGGKVAETTSSESSSAADLRIGRSLSLRTSQLGSSFEREERALLRQRCLLVLGLGLGISLVLWLVTMFVPLTEPVTRFPVWEWKNVLDLAYPGSFALAIAYVYLGRLGATALQVTVFGVAALILLLGLTQIAFAQPDVLPGPGIALTLFIPAAFIPWRVRFQFGLSTVALVGSVGTLLASYSLVPEIHAFWSGGEPVRDFGEQLFLTGLGTVLLGGTSVFVTRTLYGLRKTAFRAKRLGNYVLHKEIGEGGMGTVYVAQHALMCRPSAVKVLKVSPDHDRSALARFEQEVRLSSSLSHPNTITIFDFGRAAVDTFYYAMEYLEGLDLEGFVERFGPIPAERAVFILEQIAGSLAEAHARSIIHRDLKPSNVFLTVRGGLYDFVKVLDFGLAKQIKGADTPAGLTKTGVVFGTPRYLAPESVYGNAGVDARSDIYTLGAVAYWMLTGRAPFTAKSPVELMIDHVKTVPPKPSEVSELDIPPELDLIVMNCLEKEPDRRFQSIREVAQALSVVPLDPPWTREKAEGWWKLHMSTDEAIHECFCSPIEETEPSEDVVELSVAGA
jgi:serine/threonine-protein kinase